MIKLSPTQERALELIRDAGTYYSQNAISRATIRVLERHGLVTVEWSVQTWTNYRSGRIHHQCEWIAKIK